MGLSLVENALSVVATVQYELEKGSRFYDIKTGLVIEDPKKIIEALLDNRLEIERRDNGERGNQAP